jgi:hypothetical protein
MACEQGQTMPKDRCAYQIRLSFQDLYEQPRVESGASVLVPKSAAFAPRWKLSCVKVQNTRFT